MRETSSDTVGTAISHKEAATDFLRLASSGNIREAFDAHVGENFRHHNPSFRGDATALADAMEANAAEYPDKQFMVEHVLEDGDLVAAHSRARLAPSEPEIALVHLFRFAGERIVELWDIGQPVPGDSPNENGMF